MLGRQLIRWFDAITAFRVCHIQRKQLMTSSSLDRIVAPVCNRKEVIEQSKQERSKFPFSNVDLCQCFMLDQVQKKTLGQILGVLWPVSAPADMRIEWVPIDLAEFR
jgi:hypothetical protein